MSREIDLTQPLSDEDRAYLQQRSREDLIEIADRVEAGEEYSDSMLTAGPVTAHDTDRLGPNTGDVNTLGRVGYDERDEDGADWQEQAQEGYSSWTVKDLKAEIDRRNAERDEDDHISKQGKQAELAARLATDDDENGDDSDDDES